MPFENDGNEQNQSEVPDSGGTSTVPPSSEPFRFSNDDTSIPQWMWGKTPQEVAAATQQLVSTSAYAQQPQQYDAQQHTAPTAPNPDLMYSDPGTYQRQLLDYQSQVFQQQLASVALPVMRSQADLARSASKQDPMVSHVWNRYEPEIEAELRGIPAHQRSKVLYDKAAEIVQGRHYRELAREEASKLAASSGFMTDRSNNVGDPAQPSQGDALDTFWKTDHPSVRFSERNGVSKAQVRDFCKKMQISVDQYVKNAQIGSLTAGNDKLTRSY